MIGGFVEFSRVQTKFDSENSTLTCEIKSKIDHLFKAFWIYFITVRIHGGSAVQLERGLCAT